MNPEDLVRSAYDAWNRGDVDALVALADPEIELVPLVSAITSPGPWYGHDGVRALVSDAQDRWARVEVRCDEVLTFGNRIVAMVHVETVAREGAPVVSGDIAHFAELRDGLFTRFVAYRDRQTALAAAQA